MHENKIFYFIYLFIFDENQVFNTWFVFLQYKNTNQYWLKYSKIFAKNHRFFKTNLNFFLDWAHSAYMIGLDLASQAWNSAKVIKLPLHCSSPFCQLTQNAGNTFYHRDCGRSKTYRELERWGCYLRSLLRVAMRSSVFCSTLSLFLSFPICSPLSSSFCFLLLLAFLLSYALPSSVSLFLTFPSPSVFFFLFSVVSSPSPSLFSTLSSLCFFFPSVSLPSSFSPFLSCSFLLISLLLLSPSLSSSVQYILWLL